MELRDRRVWSLRDLLGIAGEPPTAAGDGSTEVESWYTNNQTPTHPTMAYHGRNRQIVCPRYRRRTP